MFSYPTNEQSLLIGQESNFIYHTHAFICSVTDLSEEIGEVIGAVHLTDTFSSSTLGSLDHHRVAHLLCSLSGRSYTLEMRAANKN